ncbi:hypothetical protein F2Q69_00058109 [Brassica cretica]|uniref:Uncharacterized protein n=1 Tax=Brassica cretica TaxID=69181 RepID=A0A8S9RIU8_BRACR|nr:hypothetical protein F2Q69_00058109 [Brassica cretica]
MAIDASQTTEPHTNKGDLLQASKSSYPMAKNLSDGDILPSGVCTVVRACGLCFLLLGKIAKKLSTLSDVNGDLVMLPSRSAGELLGLLELISSP